MAKFLLVIAVFIVVYLFLRNHARRKDASARSNGAAAGSANPQAFAYGQDMVRCNACGVHLPKSEAVTSRGDFFCSQEHLQIAGRKPTQP